MDTLLIIRQNYSNFTNVEKKIADYIFEIGESILEKSSQEASKDLTVSSATLVRFSRKIGFSGFAQLKQKLSASYALHAEEQSYYEEVNDSETPNSIKNKLKIRINHMVEATNLDLNDSSLTKVNQLIDGAELVFIFGIGASSIVAEDFYQKFIRIGKRVFIHQDVHLLAASMAIYKKDAIFIVVSARGETKECIELSKIAISSNIPIVVLTTKENSTLATLSDYCLISNSGEDYQMRTAATMSLMSQLYVVDVLFYMYVSENFKESYGNIENTATAIKLLNDKTK